ncbi:MAG: ferritin-like domain-containing protein [Mycolicibacterium insubricum]|nr:ferritin-like domain-containing protein [Mycobacterium sp.]
MTTRDKYTEIPESYSWGVPCSGETRFTWEYDDSRARLLALYQKGKDKQWDAQSRIDWSTDVDPMNPLGLPDEVLPLFGSPMWESADDKLRAAMRQHSQAWQFSQFLHGEQGAMMCAAKIVEVVPDMDAKFYAATQTMDEARHVETFSRFLQEKIGLVYPINKHLTALLDDTLRDSRWDMPYLGMQVLVEGLALAAFGVQRDLAAPGSLGKQVLAYVMQDEARHVAFGRISLKDYYRELTDSERNDREEFVVDACYLMRDRFRGEEVFETLGLDVQACAEWVDTAPMMAQFRAYLFSRIVPIVKDIGLWGPKVRKAFADMGVIDMAGIDIDALMKADEDQAESLEQAHAEMARRAVEVDGIIATGAA